MRGVAHELIGELGYVNESVLMDTNINKCTEFGDIGNDTRKLHAFHKVIDSMYVMVEFEYFDLATWVEPWLFELLQDVTECVEPYIFAIFTTSAALPFIVIMGRGEWCVLLL